MLGDAKQKLQRMVDLAEDLYANVNDLKQRVEETTESVEQTTETVEETNERVADLAAEVRAQRVILEALAEDRGLDVELPPEFEAAGAEESGTSSTSEEAETSDETA